MKKTQFSIFFMLILVSTLYIPNTFAQDYTQWGLPDGAKARLGKGTVSEVKYSPDGTKLAVASSIGVWIYDAQTGEELDLFTGHTHSVHSVAFSPDGNTLASGSGSWERDDPSLECRHRHTYTNTTRTYGSGRQRSV